MFRTLLIATTVLVVLASAAVAQIPPRYEVVQVTQNPYYESSPRMNNHGQVVFMQWPDVHDHRTQEVFLYDDGELIQLTADYVQDFGPDINDAGQIVWGRGIGPINPETGLPTLEIVVWEDGELTRLTDNDAQEWDVSVNNSGHVAWTRDMGDVCGGVPATDIFLYNGIEIQEITTNGLSEELTNQSPEINDLGWIVWTQYDFCVNPWESAIMLYTDGNITQISPPDTFEPQMPTINNSAQAAWQFELGRGDKGIQLWEDGVVTVFTNWGMNVRLNDHGDMHFIRWYEQERVYQAWLYLRGEFCQLSDDPFWNANGDINNLGECAWGSGDYSWTDIRVLRRSPPDEKAVGAALAPVRVQSILP